jgi:hypothetical protein
VRFARSTAALSLGERGGRTNRWRPRCLAGLFELGGKLRAAIDLHGADGEGHAVLPGVEELRGGLSGGAGVRLQHVPAGNHIASGELFEDHTGNGTDIQGIDFDQVAGLRSRIFLGFAHGVRAETQGAARSRDAAARWFDQSALLLESSENAAHHGNRNRYLLAA